MLNLDPDDTVVVATNETRLIARVHGGQPCGTHPDPVVGLNGLYRETLGVEMDDAVQITSCTPIAATEVTLQADVPMCRPFGPEDGDELRKSLYHRPVLLDTQLWLMSEDCQHFGVVPGDWHPLRVVDTDPEQPVYIDQQTMIRTPQRRLATTAGESLGAQSWEAIRARVLIRDERTCQNPRCDADTTDLEVHFVVPPRTRGVVDTENLVTLCQDCHEATHRRRYTV
jgi:5-methylcytosine-specific restriction endonuclease McrA